MSIKTGSIKTAENKDFGRRLYMSGKDYVTQMRQTTDRARLNEQEYPLSEFKKPYAVPSYEEMEYLYSPTDSKGLPDIPLTSLPDIPVMPPETSILTSGLSMTWDRSPQEEVLAGAEYAISVKAGCKEASRYTNGKVTKYQRTYRIPVFSLAEASVGAKGFDLEVFVRNAWYGWDSEELKTLYRRGLVPANPMMQAKLITKSNASGEFYVKVSDGQTILKNPVGIQSSVSGPDYWFIDTISGKYISYADLLAGNYSNLINAGDIIFDSDQEGSLPAYSPWQTVQTYSEALPDTFWTRRLKRISSGTIYYTFSWTMNVVSGAEEGNWVGGLSFGINSAHRIACEFDFTGDIDPSQWITPTNMYCSAVILSDVFSRVAIVDGELFTVSMGATEPSVSYSATAHGFYRSETEYLCAFLSSAKQVVYAFRKAAGAKYSNRIDYSGSGLYLAEAVYSGTRK